MNDDTLRRIEQKLDELLKIMKAMPTGTTTYSQKSVDDSDLDGKYGNPAVRIMAKDWNGPDYTGWNFSDCPAEYLDLHAKMLDAFAKKQAADPVKAKYADWSAKDAARARQALEFFRWAWSSGSEQAKALDYVPLPAELVQQSEVARKAGRLFGEGADTALALVRQALEVDAQSVPAKARRTTKLAMQKAARLAPPLPVLTAVLSVARPVGRWCNASS